MATIRVGGDKEVGRGQNQFQNSVSEWTKMLFQVCIPVWKTGRAVVRHSQQFRQPPRSRALASIRQASCQAEKK